MTEISGLRCDNHECRRTGGGGGKVFCPLCLQPQYCSSDCQLIDWANHACGNAISVSDGLTDTLLVPYHFENLMSPEAVQAQPVNSPIFANHAVLSHHSNQTVCQRQVPARVGPVCKPLCARKCVDPGLVGKFSIVLKFTGDEAAGVAIVEVAGKMPRNLVFRENVKNPLAQQQAKAQQQSSMSSEEVVFWPAMSQDSQTIPVAGQVAVVLTLPNSRKVSFTEHYSVTEAVYAHIGLNREAHRHYQRQLAIKFGKRDTKDYITLCSSSSNNNNNNTSHQLLLTFLARHGEAPILVDVELAVPLRSVTGTPEPISMKEALPGASVTSFSCDPRSIEQVHGLTMAIERVIALDLQPLSDDQQFLNSAAVVRNYALGEDMSAPSAEVSTAIQHTVEALHKCYAPVGKGILSKGLSLFTNAVTRVKSMSFRTKAEAQEEYEKWITLARDARAAGEPATNALRRAQMVIDAAKNKGFFIDPTEVRELRNAPKYQRTAAAVAEEL